VHRLADQFMNDPDGSTLFRSKSNPVHIVRATDAG
jgi:hypothetical protein